MNFKKVVRLFFIAKIFIIVLNKNNIFNASSIILACRYTLCYNNIKGKSFLICDGGKLSWFRSGHSHDAHSAQMLSASGSEERNWIHKTYGVRPALHSVPKGLSQYLQNCKTICRQ